MLRDLKLPGRIYKMPKALDLPLFEKSILHVVNNNGGIKLLDLIIPLWSGLNDEGYQVTGEEIENLIHSMIAADKICEITYMIKGRTRSFLLPRNTNVSGMDMNTAYIDPSVPLGPNTSPPLPTDEMKTGYVSPPTT